MPAVVSHTEVDFFCYDGGRWELFSFDARVLLLLGKDARLEGVDFLLTSALGDVGHAGLNARAVRSHLREG